MFVKRSTKPIVKPIVEVQVGVGLAEVHGWPGRATGEVRDLDWECCCLANGLGIGMGCADIGLVNAVQYTAALHRPALLPSPIWVNRREQPDPTFLSQSYTTRLSQRLGLTNNHYPKIAPHTSPLCKLLGHKPHQDSTRLGPPHTPHHSSRRRQTSTTCERSRPPRPHARRTSTRDRTPRSLVGPKLAPPRANPLGDGGRPPEASAPVAQFGAPQVAAAQPGDLALQARVHHDDVAKGKGGAAHRGKGRHHGQEEHGGEQAAGRPDILR